MVIFVSNGNRRKKLNGGLDNNRRVWTFASGIKAAHAVFGLKVLQVMPT